MGYVSSVIIQFLVFLSIYSQCDMLVYLTAQHTNVYLVKITDSTSLSTGAVVTMIFTITFIVTLTVSVIITFVTFVIVKKKFEKIYKTTYHPTQQMPVYETVSTITKSDMKLEANPAYGTSDRVAMNDNPAYQSCN